VERQRADDHIRGDQRSHGVDLRGGYRLSWNGPSDRVQSLARWRNFYRESIYGFYPGDPGGANRCGRSECQRRCHWDRRLAVFAAPEFGPSLRRAGPSFHRRRYRNPGYEAKCFCPRYLPGGAVRLRALEHARIRRIEQQPRRWRQYFSLDQRGRTLRGVPFFRDEFGGQRYEWGQRCVCARHLRGRAVRLHTFHAARFRRDRWNPGQWCEHFGDDRRVGPLHHVQVRCDESRLCLVFRVRTFPARHLRRSGWSLYAFHAAAGLVLIHPAILIGRTRQGSSRFS